MNDTACQPMDRRKLAEVQVRVSEQEKGQGARETAKVLVCGPSSERQAEMTRFLTAFEYEPVTARSAERALEAARAERVDCAIWIETEVTARRSVMIQAASRLREMLPGTESILVGPTELPEYAAAAFQAGVYNCMSWPVDYANLARDLDFLSLEAQRRREVWLWSGAEREVVFEGLVGGSGHMTALYQQLQNLAKNNEPVLVAGPVGSGKELAASALHSLMDHCTQGQSYQPLLIYRCCGLTSERAEDLFAPQGILGPVSGDLGLTPDSGSERDGPSPASTADLLGFTKPGMLLIDEISDLPFIAQQKLAAWLLVNKAVRKYFPVRIIASSRCDLEKLVEQGKFHAGLLRLLQAQMVVMPALHERREDIPMLVEHFLGAYIKEQIGVEQISTVPELSRDAQRALLLHDWPGNVRELENAVVRAAMLAKNHRIEAHDLGLAAPADPVKRLLDWHVVDELNRSAWLN